VQKQEYLVVVMNFCFFICIIFCFVALFLLSIFFDRPDKKEGCGSSNQI